MLIPFALPFYHHKNTQTLRINPAKKDIDSFVFEDFEIVGYEPHKKIEMQMAV